MLPVEKNYTTVRCALVTVYLGVSRVIQTDLDAANRLLKLSKNDLIQVSSTSCARPSRHPPSLQGTGVIGPEILGRRAK